MVAYIITMIQTGDADLRRVRRVSQLTLSSVQFRNEQCESRLTAILDPDNVTNAQRI